MVQTTTDNAKENAKEVAASSKEHAGEVVQQAGDRARDLAGEARSQLRAQADTQASKFAETLSSFASELHSMAGAAHDPESPAAAAAREVGDRAGHVAKRLRSEGLDGMVEDVKRFARQRPGMFLLGAAAAGFAAGRLLRNTDTKALADAAKPSEESPSTGDGVDLRLPPPSPSPLTGTSTGTGTGAGFQGGPNV